MDCACAGCEAKNPIQAVSPASLMNRAARGYNGGTKEFCRMMRELQRRKRNERGWLAAAAAYPTADNPADVRQDRLMDNIFGLS